MPTFKYDKLVRDKIPGWHVDEGHAVKGRQLSQDELISALIEKLGEEALEVKNANNHEELVEELGDVHQILNDLCVVAGIGKEALAASIEKKTARKGGFQKGEYIDTVTIPDENDKWAQYCRKSPDKYPEVVDE